VDFGWVGVVDVDFVDCDDDWDVGCLYVVECFDGLWYYVVVGSDDEDCDVGDFCIMGLYGCEGFVVWGVDEGDCVVDVFVFMVDLVGIDVLCDVFGFVGYDVFVVDCVE